MKSLLAKVPRGRPLLIFLDYDGTLVRIQRSPERATLSAPRRRRLAELRQRAFVSVVSGRSLAELARLVRLPGIALVGNHGLEVGFQDKRWLHPDAGAALPALRSALASVVRRVKSWPGVFVEDKGVTASVHYRMAAAAAGRPLRKLVEEEVGRRGGELVLREGKKVLEVRPNVDWDKGRAVLFLMESFGLDPCSFPVYIGDDQTDEDAFRALRGRGLTILVGSRRKTRALGRLADVGQVWKFLASL